MKPSSPAARSLHGAKFSGAVVTFALALFSGGTVTFRGEFSGGQVGFALAEFSGGEVDFTDARLSGSKIDFSHAGGWSVPPAFPWTGTPPSGVILPKKKDQSEA